MARITYLRVSTDAQDVEAQRKELGDKDKEFADVGVSGGVLAAQRPAFAELLRYVREGDVVAVYAIDRLGRDAIDVQTTVDALRDRGVSVEVLGIGVLKGKDREEKEGRKAADGVTALIVAVLAQVAEMERHRIAERCAAGREAARASLAATGLTHRGKASLGRPVSVDPAEVRSWRSANSASIAQTAEHFGVSIATVKRACAAG
jgi:putative DNA-invertase from lambdoid prophage Rac